MRWLSPGIIKKIDCDIHYIYHPDEHKFGTGFHVFKKTKPVAIGFGAVKSNIHNTCVVYIYI